MVFVHPHRRGSMNHRYLLRNFLLKFYGIVSFDPRPFEVSPFQLMVHIGCLGSFSLGEYKQLKLKEQTVRLYANNKWFKFAMYNSHVSLMFDLGMANLSP